MGVGGLCVECVKDPPQGGVDREISSLFHYHMNSGLPLVSEFVLSLNTYVPD